MSLSQVEKQELHCHECNKYVQFELDMSLNGNHVLNCPNCGHEHCRVVKDGKITSDRWDQRNKNTYTIACNYTSWTNTSTWTMYTSTTNGNSFTYNAWMDTTINWKVSG